MRKGPSYDMLGISVHTLTLSDLKAIVKEAIKSDQRCVVGHHNLHSVYLYHHDLKMQAFYDRAQYIYMDGMALLWFGKVLGYPFRVEHRLTSLDFIRPLMADAVRQGWRIFYLGSKPGVAERGAEVMKEESPGLQISTAHGYFSMDPDSNENRKVLDLINAYRPNLLMVGMGMPRQEHWIVDNVDNLQVNVVMSIGALTDYLAGEQSTPPRWMGPLVLEWAFRLFNEPGRLWTRYLLEPWFVLWLLLRGWAKRGSARR
jgi:N-acetylglucosaminyldiphosphoundecaprenol N-acetyl-beta-D-mannosaminyltransferase